MGREKVKWSGRKWRRRRQKKMEWKGRAQDGLIERNSFKWSGREENGRGRSENERNGMEVEGRERNDVK
jgi:hypothetical protein